MLLTGFPLIVFGRAREGSKEDTARRHVEMSNQVSTSTDGSPPPFFLSTGPSSSIKPGPPAAREDNCAKYEVDFITNVASLNCPTLRQLGCPMDIGTVRTLGQSQCRTLRRWDCRTLGQSQCRTLRRWDCRTLGQSQCRTLRRWCCRSVRCWDSQNVLT
jgi:hypothetical protein